MCDDCIGIGRLRKPDAIQKCAMCVMCDILSAAGIEFDRAHRENRTWTSKGRTLKLEWPYVEVDGRRVLVGRMIYGITQAEANAAVEALKD